MADMLGASPPSSFLSPTQKLRLVLTLRCSPGRFFAANELKALLAYIVLNYDLKLGGDGKRPANLFRGAVVIPSPTGQVLFRRRQIASP